MNWHPEGWGFWNDDNDNWPTHQTGRLCVCKHGRKHHRQGALSKNNRFKLFVAENSNCNLCKCTKYEEDIPDEPIEE